MILTPTEKRYQQLFNANKVTAQGLVNAVKLLLIRSEVFELITGEDYIA